MQKDTRSEKKHGSHMKSKNEISSRLWLLTRLLFDVSSGFLMCMYGARQNEREAREKKNHIFFPFVVIVDGR